MKSIILSAFAALAFGHACPTLAQENATDVYECLALEREGTAEKFLLSLYEDQGIGIAFAEKSVFHDVETAQLLEASEGNTAQRSAKFVLLLGGRMAELTIDHISDEVSGLTIVPGYGENTTQLNRTGFCRKTTAAASKRLPLPDQPLTAHRAEPLGWNRVPSEWKANCVFVDTALNMQDGSFTLRPGVEGSASDVFELENDQASVDGAVEMLGDFGEYSMRVGRGFLVSSLENGVLKGTILLAGVLAQLDTTITNEDGTAHIQRGMCVAPRA